MVRPRPVVMMAFFSTGRRRLLGSRRAAAAGSEGGGGQRKQTGTHYIADRHGRAVYTRSPGEQAAAILSAMDERLRRALDAIDALHREDPRSIDGTPAELAYAERMSATLEHLAPGASEALRVAVRAQHLCRFRVPRVSFPEGKIGYHRWRTEQLKLHASLAREVVLAAGYDEAFAARVMDLIRKKNLATDAEAQALEDAACVVFLAYEAADFARGKDEAQLVDILRKTWAKMSERGRRAALELELAPEVRALVERALA